MGRLERPVCGLLHGHAQNATWHGPNGICTQLHGAFFADLFSVFGFHRRFPIDLMADPATESVLFMVSETLLRFVF